MRVVVSLFFENQPGFDGGDLAVRLLQNCRFFSVHRKYVARFEREPGQ
jgi:hypothetical protein